MAVVSVDPVDAPASILTGMLGAVINIMFTGLTRKACDGQIIHVHIKEFQTEFMSSSEFRSLACVNDKLTSHAMIRCR